MNHRRKHPTGSSKTRKTSSDWVYPQIEKGKSKRSRYSVARWVARCNDQLKDYIYSVSFNR